MKVLHLGNVILPKIALVQGIQSDNFGGWLSGAINALAICGIENTYLYPANAAVEGSADGIDFIAFNRRSPNIVDAALIEEFKVIINRIKPDIIHIWGSEYSHSLCMALAANEIGIIDHVVLSIQGLCFACAKAYCNGLPDEILHKKTLRDIVRHDSIATRQEDFVNRGNNEKQLLAIVKHIIGRTDWDRAECLAVNSKLKYYFCNESLRDIFYTHEQWNTKNIDRHTVFCSQGNYPIKGLHKALTILRSLITNYPDCKLRVTGKDIIKTSYLNRQKSHYYSVYLRKLIKKFGLVDHVYFLGELNDKQMADEYTKANVFLSPSNLENSSNSIAEAQLLGVPVVASNVGGCKSMINDNIDGLLYEYDDENKAVEFISKIFDGDTYASYLGANAARTATQRHNIETNNSALLAIYDVIIAKQNSIKAKG